jgi:hypothetical protein
VLAPIVVDLGPDVSASQVALVLDACNEVIENGVCVAEDPALGEPPRAVATARPNDPSVRVVHIEVRLRGQAPAGSLERDLRFAARDPVRERWRSVGLAIATLVGEGERREEREELATQRRSEPKAAEPEPAPEPTPEPVAPARSVEAAPEPAPPAPRRERRATIVDSPDEDSSAAASAAGEGVLMLGLGTLLGPASDDGSWRLGARATVGWVAPSGLQLFGSVAYAARAFEPRTYTASWLAAEVGAGYRWALGAGLSSAFSLHAGFQQQRFEAVSDGITEALRFDNPVFGVSLDAWWTSNSGFGLWAALDGASIGRSTRVFFGDTLVSSSAPVDVAASLGIGWWIR